jgi:hypothetical protein
MSPIPQGYPKKGADSLKGSKITPEELVLRIRRVVLKSLPKIEKRVSDSECLPLYDPPRRKDGRRFEGWNFKSKRFQYLLSYLVFLHFFPVDESIYYYLFVDLQEFLVEETQDSHWLSVLVEDREFFLKWLCDQQTIEEGEFFGSIASEETLVKLRYLILWRFEEKFSKPRHIVRRKGYKDKGTLPTDSQSALRRISDDYFFTLEQIRLEIIREIRSTEIDLFREYLLGERILTEDLKRRFRILPDEKGETNNGTEGNSLKEN